MTWSEILRVIFNFFFIFFYQPLNRIILLLQISRLHFMFLHFSIITSNPDFCDFLLLSYLPWRSSSFLPISFLYITFWLFFLNLRIHFVISLRKNLKNLPFSQRILPSFTAWFFRCLWFWLIFKEWFCLKHFTTSPCLSSLVVLLTLPCSR